MDTARASKLRRRITDIEQDIVDLKTELNQLCDELWKIEHPDTDPRDRIKPESPSAQIMQAFIKPTIAPAPKRKR